MKSPQFIDLKNKIEMLETKISEIENIDENELADRVYELEAEINCRIESSTNEREFNAYEKLMPRIKKIILEHNFFDEETELEIMKSDFDESGFDPFSTSDDVFGEYD